MRFGLPNPVSLFLVVGVLAGNASVAGLDLFLCLAVPAGLLLFLQSPGQGAGAGPRAGGQSAGARWAGLWAPALGIGAGLLTWRASEIGIPYFDLYGLWPAKALVLGVFLLRQRGECWPVANDVALGVVSLGLLGLSSVEDGRLYSVFGPNMLYRFFGASFLFSLIRAGHVSGPVRVMSFALVGLGVLGLMLTGSAGAVGVMLAGLYLARGALGRLVRTAWGLIACLAGIALVWAAGKALFDNLVNRLAWKYERIDDDARFTGWQRMIESEPGLWGLDYRDLGHIWSQFMPYPHNAGLELWLFYGMPGAALFGWLLWMLWRCRDTRYYFFVPLVVIAVGAMFSGDLSDNFALFCLPVVYLARRRFLVGPLALPGPARRPVPAPRARGRRAARGIAR